MYLRTVLECKPHVGFAVDRGEVQKAVPEPFVEVGYQSYPLFEFGDKARHHLAQSLLVGEGLGGFLVASLDGIEPPALLN